LVAVGIFALGTGLAYARCLPAWLGRVPHLDKVLHFGIYGFLALSLDHVLRRRDGGFPKTPVAAMFMVPSAALEEGLQGLSRVRTCSGWDYLADVSGIVLCLMVYRAIATRSAAPREAAAPALDPSPGCPRADTAVPAPICRSTW
jgi:hypothetical protein